jgi:hypothetical protein
MIKRLALICAAALGLAAPALAFDDAATGFAVRPQHPFVVTPAMHRSFDVGVAVDDSSGRIPIAGAGEHLCQAGFKAAPQNAELSQAEINAFVRRPEWKNVVKATFGLAFEMMAIRNVRVAGVGGVEIEARPKFGPNAKDARAYATILETPKGRVSLVCVTTAEAYRSAKLAFRAIRNTVTPPR